ncbi:MAG: heavy-metal-associated domain-containing protein [Bacteroidia bacterium]|nr:heavy-metal-associated domain-containing protein [Bacteroidia bacterium]
MKSITVNIHGMTCNHCIMSIRKELAKVPGVLVDEVTIGHAALRINPAIAGEEEIRRAVEAAGYSVLEINEENQDSPGHGKEIRK